MATEEQLLAGLKAADAAGNAADAQHFADQIKALRASQGPQSQGQTPKSGTTDSYTNPSASNRIDAFIRALSQGTFLNLGDELNSAKNATISPLLSNDAPTSHAPSWYQRYQENLSHDRGLEKANQKEYPVTSAAGNITGAIPLGMMMKVPQTVGQAMVQGGRLGAAYGFGSGEGGAENRVAAASIDAPLGALTAGGVSKAASVIPEIAAMFGPKGSPVPSVGELKTAARQAYQTVDNSGMRIAPNSIGSLASDVQTTLAKMGHHPKLQPKASVVLDELGNLEQTALQNGGTSLQDLDVMRRIAGHAASSIEPSDKMMGRVITDKIDDFVGQLGPKDVMGNVDQGALDALANARDLWARAAKGQTIDKLIEKAGVNGSNFSASGYENALRSQFRKLANNDRGMARFSPDERAAIQNVATGGKPLSATNILRQIGKLSPQGAIPMLAEGGAVLAGGPSLLAVPAAGLAGRAGATALTSRAANAASELARRGGPAQAPAQSVTAQAIQDIINRSAPLSSLLPISLLGQQQ